MQILTINNRNFQKTSRNPSNRTKVKILKEKIVGQLTKKFGSAYPQSPRKCSNIKILAKIQRKRSEIFFENLRRAYKDLIQVKKNSKLSHACVPLRMSIYEQFNILLQKISFYHSFFILRKVTVSGSFFADQYTRKKKALNCVVLCKSEFLTPNPIWRFRLLQLE